MEERVVVIDTDGGLDDALAIMMALRAHKEKNIAWRVLGITCVFGNTTLDNVCINVTRLVQLAELEDEIPIYRGAEKPIVRRMEKRTLFYHGADGFGDADFPPIKPRLEEEHAVDALIRLAHEYEGRLTVITLGPLTNIALAINMDSTFSSCLKELCCMGGNVSGMGNIRPCAEFNFWADPESVHVVLESAFKRPILLVPWETCKLEARSTLDWRLNSLGKVHTKEAKFMNKIEENILLRNTNIHNGWVACDALVPAVMLNPRLTKKTESYYCQIELNGFHTRGQMVLDHPRMSGRPDNVLAIIKIDMTEFETTLLWSVYGENEDRDFSLNNHILYPV